MTYGFHSCGHIWWSRKQRCHSKLVLESRASLGNLDCMKKRIVERAGQAIFGKPLVSNNYRGILVEAIVADALGSGWNWVSEDWAAWDFERSDGVRLEVKQSAALQSWHQSGLKKPNPRFDCAARTGRWEGSQWHPETQRFADIYIFAYHGEMNAELADHRIPDQWTFFVVSEASLPVQKTIGLTKVRELASQAHHINLQDVVEAQIK